jgi:hypothetical protein
MGMTATWLDSMRDAPPDMTARSLSARSYVALNREPAPDTAPRDAAGRWLPLTCPPAPRPLIDIAACGDKLFAVAGDDSLWATDPLHPQGGWLRAGDAAAVIALCAGDRRLYALTRDGMLSARPPVARVAPWLPIAPAAAEAAVAARGSWRGTAGGSPRRSRTAARGRSRW